MGICLLGGALLVAYAERQMHAEHARQYSAAHEFFASARLRLERHLEEMKDPFVVASYPVRFLDQKIENWKAQQAKKLRIPIGKTGIPSEKEIRDMLEAIRAEGDADFAKVRENIHSLLFALGKEALDENSEWLILHRARPMEPVMAG